MNSLTRSSVTVLDVANTACVSVGTVSRVLNGKANISPENVDRVTRAMASLGYKKKATPTLPLRRAGSKARTGNIGLVFVELGRAWSTHSLISAYALGVEQACQERGFNAMVEMADESESIPRCVREGKVDGILIKATRRAPNFINDLPAGFPVVGVSFNAPALSIHQVSPDNRGAGWVMAHYLWQKGHRRIAFVTTDSTHPMFIARLQGYESFMREKRSFNPALVIVPPHHDYSMAPEEAPRDMRREVDQLLSYDAAQRPTAIIAANDWMARGLYGALKQRGVRIPKDVSVVGFDNTEELCSALTPPLTSYRIPFTATARAAAIALFARIETPTLCHHFEEQLIRGELIDRESVLTLRTPDREPESRCTAPLTDANNHPMKECSQ